MAEAIWNETTIEPRIARYGRMRAEPMTFLDAALPEHERDILNVVGKGVSENRGASATITDVSFFNIQMARCEPGKGAGLHSHETVEVFFVAQGRFEVFFGPHGEHKVVLEQFDTISVPPGLFRGFRNITDRQALIFAVLGGDDPGTLTWAPSLEEAVRKRGYTRDADKKVVTAAG